MTNQDCVVDLHGEPISPLVVVLWTDDGTRSVHEWPSYWALGIAYWQAHATWVAAGSEVSLPGTADPTDDFVWQAVTGCARDALAVVRALIETAPDDPAIEFIGAGALEGLVRDERLDDGGMDLLTDLAATNARYRTALANVWIGPDTEHRRTERLRALGARRPGE